jgi:fructosamine-3-kinase
MSLRESLSAEIGRAISENLGRPFRAESAREAGGGCIHRAVVLEGGGERWFVKLNGAGALPMFEAEADGLAALEQAGAFRVPRPLASGIADGQAYLVLEHLDLRPIATRDEAIAYGRALAALHRTTGARYGWRRDNFIGATPQINTESDGWARFFAEARLRPQLARAETHGAALRKKGESLADKLPAFLLDYRPQASLLHGDLWHGNAAMCGNAPALFDPAVYYGDRECDLAMTELFGGFPEAFYAAYREAWPLPEGYESRKTLYNLYHVLNHLNLFGAGYLRQAERMVDKLLAELRG